MHREIRMKDSLSFPTFVFSGVIDLEENDQYYMSQFLNIWFMTNRQEESRGSFV